jgi:PHD/YefM family antitoxin component YafN of YafNO toxin-antitoxin module
MDTIKKILQKNKNASVIVVENNKPVYVIISFEEYERLNGLVEENPSSSKIQPEENALDEINREIINLGAPQEQSVQIVEEEEPQEIRVEDIPLL